LALQALTVQMEPMVQTVQPAQPVQQALPEQQGHRDRLALRVPMEPMA